VPGLMGCLLCLRFAKMYKKERNEREKKAKRCSENFIIDMVFSGVGIKIRARE
jgi:hypothetical protein